MSRHHVHLSDNINTAKLVGNRHSLKSIVLIINAEDMYNDGIEFYVSDNGVWLVNHINTNYIH